MKFILMVALLHLQTLMLCCLVASVLPSTEQQSHEFSLDLDLPGHQLNLNQGRSLRIDTSISVPFW